MPPTIHQVVPAVVPGDAIGDHVLQVDRLFRDLGIPTQVYAEAIDPAVGAHVRPFSARRPGSSDWCVYHVGSGSQIADVLLAGPDALVIDYHNITPPGFFLPYAPVIAAALAYGRRQLRSMAPRARLGIGDSAYNAEELAEAGCPRNAVAPILLDLARFEGSVDPATAGRLAQRKGRGGADWLFVGRVAPNKAHHDLVKAFAVYRQIHDPDARLNLVGDIAAERYGHALTAFIRDLGLSESVTTTGRVTHAELIAHYRAADVFVCVSEHEGFCVPLLEAMHHRLPIVAYAAGAVPETLGNGGLSLDDKRPLTVAAAVHRVLSDERVRGALVAAGQARLTEFTLERTRQRFLDALAPLGVRA